MERDSFVFYRSFAESLNELSDEEKLATLNMIIEYGLNGETLETKGVPRALFLLIKPQLDANNKRYSNGKKGGRSTEEEPTETREETEEKPRENRTVTKTEPKPNLTVTESEPNENVNVNENVNDNDNVNAERKKIKKERAPYSDDPELDKAIRDFIDDRKKRRKPMTERAIELFIARLNKLSSSVPEQIALINSAIEHGWQTVYPSRDAGETRAGGGENRMDDYLLGIINGEGGAAV